MQHAILASLAVALVIAIAGCHLARLDGPTSRTMASSRQFSQQGVAAMERGQWDRAESLLSQAVRACPSNPDAHRHYAETLWHRGQRPAAIAELADALSKDPEDANLHVRMAEMRLAMGETESALKTAEHAIDLDPKLASAWAVHARVMRARKNLHEALANYHRALGYNSSDRQIPLEIAEVYRETGRPERALATLQALAESYTPGDEPQRLLHLEGLAYFDLARYSDSAHSLAEAAQRGQPSPDLLFHLASAQRGAGEVSAAAETARQVLALDPRHESGRQLVEEMELVQRIDARTER